MCSVILLFCFTGKSRKNTCCYRRAEFCTSFSLPVCGLFPAFHLYDLADSGQLLLLFYPVIIMPDIGQATTQQNPRQKDDQSKAKGCHFPHLSFSMKSSTAFIVASDTMVYAVL